MTENFQSALFPGHVTHTRLRPKGHKLAYKIYSLLLDLDELEALDGKLKLFSLDRFNLFSFYRQDRGDGSSAPLREQVERAMDAAGVMPDGGAVRLLTMPRILGWAFNPLSVFFCYNQGGDLVAILWEVDNTFRQRHGYLIPVENDSNGRIVQSCDKAFYVSPFMDMKLRYEFEVSPPKDKLSIRINSFDDEGLVMTARHLARRIELTDAALLRAFFSIPFLTLKVVGGIHWEALKIWLKGIGLRKRPQPPHEPITHIRQGQSGQRSEAV
ncbi:DUF1365 family protein [Brucella pseudogrignonensis]|uniref:DUF1365 domain-containing protein n=1 Tax=Brucella pseudogrignonensis TaxID=419475 RepID=UPI0028B62A35|nr:DUF1365 family protein [Brucella pseudogrignonensis]MDT6941031.1 DUF1365 family protein [Brucella pseudogrignonensis]